MPSMPGRNRLEDRAWEQGRSDRPWR